MLATVLQHKVKGPRITAEHSHVIARIVFNIGLLLKLYSQNQYLVHTFDTIMI